MIISKSLKHFKVASTGTPLMMLCLDWCGKIFYKKRTALDRKPCYMRTVLMEDGL